MSIACHNVRIQEYISSTFYSRFSWCVKELMLSLSWCCGYHFKENLSHVFLWLVFIKSEESARCGLWRLTPLWRHSQCYWHCKSKIFFLDDISCGLGESEYFPKYTVSVDVAEGSVTPKCPRSFKQIEVWMKAETSSSLLKQIHLLTLTSIKIRHCDAFMPFFVQMRQIDKSLWTWYFKLTKQMTYLGLRELGPNVCELSHFKGMLYKNNDIMLSCS